MSRLRRTDRAFSAARRPELPSAGVTGRHESPADTLSRSPESFTAGEIVELPDQVREAIGQPRLSPIEPKNVPEFVRQKTTSCSFYDSQCAGSFRSLPLSPRPFLLRLCPARARRLAGALLALFRREVLRPSPATLGADLCRVDEFPLLHWFHYMRSCYALSKFFCVAASDFSLDIMRSRYAYWKRRIRGVVQRRKAREISRGLG